MEMERKPHSSRTGRFSTRTRQATGHVRAQKQALPQQALLFCVREMGRTGNALDQEGLMKERNTTALEAAVKMTALVTMA